MNTVPVPKVDVVKRKSALGVAANDLVWDFDCRECKSNSYVATDGTITHIHYNANGQRIAETDNDGNVLREYIYLGQQAIALAITNGDSKTTYFIHNDHLGTPKLITNISGTVVWQQHTTPFGEITNTLATGINNLKSFPGQYRDSETGYSYNYYRDYDASLGRYVQSDPIGLQGGLNTYGYVGGNPIGYADPSGLIWWNNISPYTIPVEGETYEKLLCVETCLKPLNKFYGKTADGMLCTGGQEQWKNGDPTTNKKYHSWYSAHYTNSAVYIAGKKFQNFTDDEVYTCAVSCGFKAGQYEEFKNSSADHWHLQLEPGNGVPALGQKYYKEAE